MASLLSLPSSDEEPLYTLETILESKEAYYEQYHSFITYLHHTYCIENLYFWQDVQSYRSSPTFEAYQKIIEKYIAVNAPYEINIPCDMRQDLLSAQQANCNECFDEAAETIFELIRMNSFLPWCCQQQKTRRSISPSLSVPNYCQISRPSFSSLRSVTSMGSFYSHFFVGEKREKNSKLADLFQRKRQAFIVKMKRAIS
ncbi:MAG: RGS domain-containing protein [Benjaminiella poitrasii]|nr:MAG: RGS domain-containing protein [Benjaminiella poitrasii]